MHVLVFVCVACRFFRVQERGRECVCVCLGVCFCVNVFVVMRSLSLIPQHARSSFAQFYFLTVDQYRSAEMPSTQRLKDATAIYDTYLAPDAILAPEIDEKAVVGCRAREGGIVLSELALCVGWRFVSC